MSKTWKYAIYPINNSKYLCLRKLNELQENSGQFSEIRKTIYEQKENLTR